MLKIVKNNPQETSTSILAKTKLECSSSTVRRELKRSGYNYGSLKVKPLLNKEQKIDRMIFAEEVKGYTKYRWKRIIFTDEKKFLLNNNDSLNLGWKKKGKGKNIIMKKNEKKSVMCWAGINFYMKTSIFYLDGKYNSEKYTKLIIDQVLPEINSCLGTNFTLQQDNCSIHTASFTLGMLKDAKVKILKWPSKSPDLSPIENCWSILSKMLYANGRTFDNISNLKLAIHSSWEQIDMKIIKNLIISMQDRVKELEDQMGDVVSY